METAALAIIALTAVAAFAGTAVGLALRNGKLTGRVAQLEANDTNAEKQLQVTSREFADYKERTDAQLAAAEGDAKELRDELEKCSAPGAQRARLDSLLSKLAPRAPSAGASRGPGPLPALATARAGDTDPEH